MVMDTNDGVEYWRFKKYRQEYFRDQAISIIQEQWTRDGRRR